MENFEEIKNELAQLNHKLNLIHRDVLGKIEKKKYITAREVGHLTSLDPRTILNRTHLAPNDKRYIPSVKFGPRRKLFERKVIERMFNLTVSGGQS
jgi:hypothetical protein